MDIEVKIVESGVVKVRFLEHAGADFDPALWCQHAVAV
jgi:hypothetical protein